MAEAAQYKGRRRKRGACLLEFLVLAGIVAIVALAIVVLVFYLLIQRYNLSNTLLWTVAVVVFGGGLVLTYWFWVTDHWDGEPWRLLAHKGRAGRVANVETADRTKLHVEMQGPSDALVTLLFVHGLGLSAAAWREQRAALADYQVRMVSYDARGHGRSGKRKLDQNIRGVRQLADDLGRVIDQTAPRGPLVIAGHGMGGMTALALPAVRPDLAERIGGYVLCSTTAGPLGKTARFGLWRILAPVSWAMRREAVGIFRLLDLLPRFVAHLIGLAPYELGVRYFAVAHRSSKTAVRPTVAIMYDNGFRQFGDLLAAAMDHDERSGLPALSAHVAVIKGENDRIVPPKDQDALASAIPNATLRSVPKCGHQTPFEAAAEVNEELLRVLGLVHEEAENEIRAAEEAKAARAAAAAAHSTAYETARTAAATAASAVGSATSTAASAVGTATSTAASAVAGASSAVRAPASAVAHAAPSTVDQIRDALGEMLEAFEDISPEGPVRSGLHTIHRVLGVNHADAERPNTDRRRDDGQ
ncbi:alpha/beta hydrolase [Skermania sp. ID1734]|uniref:alpha/beta fold hydrolase n=1 Tax=Skermania sp. ID1734 TaxID=2597516 RepID=UPI00117FB054|nr:alpha/beta hydrolase [Skermania sp. ID1734]TSD98034.1 alpha/beta hydrolase [Skermania sp. ID1734]